MEISICSSHRVLDYDARGPTIEFHRGHYILHRLNMFYCCSKLYMVFLNAGDIYNYIYILWGRRCKLLKLSLWQNYSVWIRFISLYTNFRCYYETIKSISKLKIEKSQIYHLLLLPLFTICVFKIMFSF